MRRRACSGGPPHAPPHPGPQIHLQRRAYHFFLTRTRPPSQCAILGWCTSQLMGDCACPSHFLDPVDKQGVLLSPLSMAICPNWTMPEKKPSPLVCCVRPNTCASLVTTWIINQRSCRPNLFDEASIPVSSSRKGNADRGSL